MKILTSKDKNILIDLYTYIYNSTLQWITHLVLIKTVPNHIN